MPITVVVMTSAAWSVSVPGVISYFFARSTCCCGSLGTRQATLASFPGPKRPDASLQRLWGVTTTSTTTAAVETSQKTINLRSSQLYLLHVASLDMSEADESFWYWILNEYIQVQKQTGNPSCCNHVLQKTSHWDTRKFHVVFMKWTSKGCSAKKCDDVIDVQNSCFAHKSSWLFVVTFSLPYQGTKKCDGVQNSCFSHKTDCLFVCLFLDFFFVLHVRSCCNHGNRAVAEVKVMGSRGYSHQIVNLISP